VVPRRQWKNVGGELELATTFVLGLGNVLMGDDGFGPYVARLLEADYEVGAGAEVIDIGTPGLDLTPWLADARNVIIVDTVRASAPPGTVTLYDRTDIVRHAPVSRVGPHDPGLKEALLTLEFAGRAPETVALVGVVPARVATGTTLSDPVAAAVPTAISAVVERLRRLGVPVAPRASRRPVGSGCCPWWTDGETDRIGL
jgi:hydrogenase maturation protease